MFSASKGAVQHIGSCKWRDSLKGDESSSLAICNLLESECSTMNKAELNGLKHSCSETCLTWAGWTAQTLIFKNLPRNKNRWLINILWKKTSCPTRESKTWVIAKSFCSYCYYKLIQGEGNLTTIIWASVYAYERASLSTGTEAVLFYPAAAQGRLTLASKMMWAPKNALCLREVWQNLLIGVFSHVSPGSELILQCSPQLGQNCNFSFLFSCF